MGSSLDQLWLMQGGHIVKSFARPRAGPPRRQASMGPMSLPNTSVMHSSRYPGKQSDPHSATARMSSDSAPAAVSLLAGPPVKRTEGGGGADGEVVADSEANADDLVEEEERATGAIRWSVLGLWFASIGAAWTLIIFASLVAMQARTRTLGGTHDLLADHSRAQASRNAQDVWLSRWVAALPAGSTDDSSTSLYYLHGLMIIGAANSLLTLIRAFTFAYGGLRAAVTLFARLLQAVVGAPLEFFERTPSGRILNRFSTDVYAVDEQIPFQVRGRRDMRAARAWSWWTRKLQCCSWCWLPTSRAPPRAQANILVATLFSLLGSLVVLGMSLPWLLLLLAPLAVVYYRLQRYYRGASRDLRRLDSTTRSPIFSHFGETLEGVATIRTFGVQRRFIARNKGGAAAMRVCCRWC
jgi:ATP-binding cassette subfamily C (CFTR/MRP) protein 10